MVVGEFATFLLWGLLPAAWGADKLKKKFMMDYDDLSDLLSRSFTTTRPIEPDNRYPDRSET